MDIEQLLRDGIAYHQAGNLEASERCYLLALQRKPNHPDPHHLLGVVYRSRGQIGQAIASIGIAISLYPNESSYYNNLGTCYLSRSEYTAAILCFHHALALQPEYPDALNNLGLALLESKRYDEAKVILEQVVAANPGHLLALSNLAKAFGEQGQYDQAISYYNKALTVDPSFNSALLGKAGVLSKLNMNDGALELIDRVIAHGGNHAPLAWQRKGTVLQILGRLDDACNAFDQAIELQPEGIELMYSRGQIRKAKKDEPFFKHLQRFEGALDQVSGDPRAMLCYAIGKAYQDIGEIDVAAKYFADGANAKRNRMLEYNEADQDAIVKALCGLFTREFYDALQSKGDPSFAPIFIVGMPRSGTTLTEQILGTHPEVYPAGELEFMAKELTGLDILIDPKQATDPGYLEYVSTELGRASQAYKLAIETLGGRPGLRITDKMPGNFLYVGFIALMFPNAKIIHCRRDPIDTSISCYTTLFTEGHPWSYDFGTLGRAYRRYVELMNHWKKVLPERILEVRYEETVEHTEIAARRLLSWCDLAWDDKVLDFHKTERPVKTASVTQVRQPIYKSSMGRWKKWEPYIQPLLTEIDDLEKAYWAEADSNAS